MNEKEENDCVLLRGDEVNNDDEVMEAYLEGNEPDVATLKRCIRKGTLARQFVPVINGSAFKNKGVQPLLDAVIDFLPSPVDVPSVRGTAVDDPETTLVRESKDEAPFSALAASSFTSTTTWRLQRSVRRRRCS